MIETKTFEIRDRGTFIPIVAIRIAPREWANMADVYLAGRAGYVAPLILMTSLHGMDEAQCDPEEWGTRTRQVAHRYIAEHFSELESGSVIDVEFILGETPAPKISEREEVIA